MGIEIGLGLTLAAIGGALSYSQARSANRARQQQNKAIAEAARVEKETARIAAAERREEVALQQARYLGTVRASSAARSASSLALEVSGAAQGAESVTDINTQLWMDILGIQSRAEAQKNRNKENPFLSGLQGGISGFATGLSIGNSLPSSTSGSGQVLNTKQTFGGPPEILGPPVPGGF